jgi:PAS domain S-box-containing protein
VDKINKDRRQFDQLWDEIKSCFEIDNLRESQKSIEAVRDSEAWFRALFENAAVGIARVAPDGRWLEVNQRLCDIVGYAREELMTKTFADITHSEDLKAYLKAMRLMLAGEIETYLREKRYYHKDGSIVWGNLTVFLLSKADGSPDYFVSVVEDISARKLAEEKLRENEERLLLASDAAGLGVFEWDVQADRAVWENERMYEIFGHTHVDGALSKAQLIERYVHPDDASTLDQALTGGMKSGRPVRTVYRIRRNDGVYRWFKTRATALRDSGGNVVKWFGSNTDIDDQKQAERSSLESKERLNGIVSSAMDAIITVDEEQRIVLFNGAAERVFGCPGAEAIGRPLDRFIPERFRVMHNDASRRFGENGGMCRLTALTALRADGAEFPIEASISKIEVGGRKLFTVILRDITERRQAESEREQLAREQTARAEAEYAAEKIRRLQSVTDSVLTHLTLEDLLPEMLSRIRELLETDSAAVLLLSEDGQSLVIRAAIGSQEEAIGKGIPFGRGVAGSIAASRAPLVVEDLSAVEVFNPVLRREARSLIGAPLIVKGELIGVIQADTAKLKRFTENDVRLLQLASDRVALAIEQRRIYEVEQQARRQAEEANRTKDYCSSLIVQFSILDQMQCGVFGHAGARRLRGVGDQLISRFSGERRRPRRCGDCLLRLLFFKFHDAFADEEAVEDNPDSDHEWDYSGHPHAAKDLRVARRLMVRYDPEEKS